MTIICSQVRKVCSETDFTNLQTIFLYPKLVIFENLNTFRILDLDNKSNEEPASNDLLISLDHPVIDKILKDHLLWIALRNGDLIVIDLWNGSQIKVIVENYKVCRFQLFLNQLVLISESGEYLNTPFSTKTLLEKYAENVSEETVILEKIRKRYDLNEQDLKSLNGMHIFNDVGDIAVTCPVTGLTQILSINIEVKSITSWNDLVIVTDEATMWLLDLKNSNVDYEFKSGEYRYYSAAAYKNNFYYLLWTKSEIQICCAWKALLSTDEENKDSSIKSNNKQTPQETLILQMQGLVDAALSNAESTKVLSELKIYYEQIEDLKFLLDSALKLCQYNLAYKSILYSLQKKLFCIGNTDFINTVTDLLIKVDLLEYIQFRGNNSYEFLNIFDFSCKQLCETFLAKLDVDLASICWLKYSEASVFMSATDVLDILNAMPQNMKLSSLIIWFRNFTPTLLDKNPYIIDVFVKWATQRVFSLEQSGFWPKIGLKFIESIVSVLESSLKTISLRPISIDDLDTIKDHINYITELKDKYKINLLLSEISSQSSSEVALIMLRRCYTEDLNELLQEFLPKFATRFMFEVDDILRSYVDNEAATCGGGIDSLRLQILLNAFRSPTVKLECLLQVLKVLDVPWDNTVLELAIAAVALIFKDFTVTDADRNLAEEIQKELNYAKVKVILKKYNFPLTCTDYPLILYKVINAPIVDLNDLKTVTSVMAAYTNYGNILYIDRCLKDCDTKTALIFFNNLSNKEKKVLLKTITTKYEQLINSKGNNVIVERNYLDFIKGTKLLNTLEINDIENLYHLKNSYKLALCLNTINNEKCCTDIANKWVFTDNVTASSGRGRCVFQLTHTFQSRHSTLVSLLRRTSTSNQVRKVIENLIIYFSDHTDSSNINVSSVLAQFKDGNNSKLLIDSFNVLIEVIEKCPEEHLHYLTNILSILNALINTNVTVKNLSVIWKFHYIFLTMSSVTAANDLINLYCNISQNNLERILENITIKNDVVFRILGTIFVQSIESKTSLTNKYFEMKDNAIERLLPKIIASQELDEVFLTNLLLILSGSKEEEDYMWVLSTLQGQNESLPFNLTCYLSSPVIRRTFALDNVIPGNTVTYPPQYMLKTKFNINLNDMAMGDCTEETWDVKVVLFYVLRQYPDTSFERLVELCRTLSVSINDGLSLQLISLLTSWELQYTAFCDEFGCKQVCLRNDEQTLLAKCFIIWDSVPDKTFLKDILNDFWKNGEVTLHGRQVSINPYYYEVYVCIYHLIYSSSNDLRHKKDYFLLNFLREYRRKSTPRQYEFELFSVKGMFPEIGYYRLPFHLFMREDMWSNLKSEITLETYERWLPAVPLLALDADLQTANDMICSNALKQTMTSRQRTDNSDDNSKDNEPWRLTTREEPLLRAAHRCVRHIANMEWAGACLFYVLQGCARGADQVAAAHLCYQFAQRWAALQPGNRAVRQMERLHSTLSTRHALHKIEWTCDEFVRLTAEPAQLIRALYLHPQFIDKMSRHDVNRAANEIADKNGINISSIRIQILENILTKTNEENKNRKLCGLDMKDLMTAKYILKATCPKMGAIYLSRIAFDDESDFDKCKKLRALQCLMSVIDSDTAVKVTNRDRDDLWSSLIESLSIVNLENIDMPWIIATFTQDKIRAIEQLLQTNGASTDTLKIAADLARRFGNINLYRNLLPHLLRSGLYEEVIPLLMKISCPPDDMMYSAWRAVILSPFQRADYPITESQKAKCLYVINLLPVCPVIKDNDLLEIWKHCVRCKCFGLGCLVLPYISPEKRQAISELKKIDRRNLIASLKNLQSETYLVSGAMYVVENMTSRSYR